MPKNLLSSTNNNSNISITYKSINLNSMTSSISITLKYHNVYIV